jgi:glycosyltransferase involved in cell wall biosynthesis
VEAAVSHAAIAIPGLDRIAGAERQAMLLARGLRRRGWRVSMVALSGTGGAAATELTEAGVSFLSLGMRKGLADPRGWRRFHRWIRCEKPDVLHAHLPHAAWLARWLRLAALVPVVVDTLHSSATGDRWRRLGYAASRWLPDHVTAVSEASASAHVAAGMVDPDRLSVVSNGIDVDRWKPDLQTRLKVREELGLRNEFLWLAVGRLEPVKDYPTLLNAFARAPQSAELLVLGAGWLEADLKQLAGSLGLGQRVRFEGFRTDVARWMQAADGFVLTSRHEGLPMVLLEAGACGLPVVATNVPGTCEVVIHGETGWLTPAGDPEQLAAAMGWLMRIPLRKRLGIGERARKSIVERFSLEAALDHWEQLYTDLLARKDPRGRTERIEWESLRRRSAHSA